METQTLTAEVRKERGKGPARQLRAQGKIPAVFYGPGVDTTAIAVAPAELVKALKTDYGRNVIFKMEVGGTEQLAMLKDVDVHPVSRAPLHADFYRVTTDSAVEVRVPVKTAGRPVGVQKGGKLNVVFRDLPVRTTPEKIPAAITINVASLDIGDVTTVSQLDLDEGVHVLYAPDRRVVLVTEDKRKVAAADDADDGEGEAEAN
ncbi:MAG: 50S ribosomal protein L25 [Myxococcota bacterium]